MNNENMNIINLTPHEVTFVTEAGDVILTVAPSGTIARCTATTVDTGRRICGIPVKKTVLGEVYDLPDPQEGTIYIVSRPVAEAAGDRDDLFIPNETVRNERGQVAGARSFGIV